MNFSLTINHFNHIPEERFWFVGIRTISDYVKFFINLEMGNSVTLLSFVNNEKLILRNKLKNKEIKKEPIVEGLKILDDLIFEIKSDGEKRVLQKYGEM